MLRSSLYTPNSTPVFVPRPVLSFSLSLFHFYFDHSSLFLFSFLFLSFSSSSLFLSPRALLSSCFPLFSPSWASSPTCRPSGFFFSSPSPPQFSWLEASSTSNNHKRRKTNQIKIENRNQQKEQKNNSKQVPPSLLTPAYPLLPLPPPGCKSIMLCSYALPFSPQFLQRC